jgi:osmoprotectant transport system permease protein
MSLADGFWSEWWQFVSDPATWRGTAGIPNRLVEHVQMSVASTLTALALALPSGLVLGHLRRGGFLAVSISNLARAVPTFGIIALAFRIFGLGPEAAFVALVVLAVPPILVNTYTGVSGVDDDLREAAAGMGMRGREVLFHVELPVALPLIMAGIRTAAVQVVATATLAAVIAWGGLGRFIIDGIAQRDDVEVFTGALLVALLALVTEGALAVLERLVVSRGLRSRALSKSAATSAGEPASARIGS